MLGVGTISLTSVNEIVHSVFTMNDDLLIDLVRQVAAAYRDGRRVREEELEAARERIAELEAELRRRGGRVS